jgi:hypothetical protein
MKNPEYAAGYNAAMAEVRAARETKLASKKVTKTIRAKQKGLNKWDVFEEIYFGEPDERRVILESSPTFAAEDAVRVYLETALGPNRLGDSGMPS